VNLSWLDWAIVIAAVVALRFVSLSTRTHCKGVADFLSANRMAGRYLLTIASGMGGMGVVSFVAQFEMTYQAGLPPIWRGRTPSQRARLPASRRCTTWRWLRHVSSWSRRFRSSTCFPFLSAIFGISLASSP
jgi:hypothetical protein